METDAAEAEAQVSPTEPEGMAVRAFTRARPVRAPLPAHLPRERVVLPAPTVCPCCGGRLAKLGETITETLEVIPRTYKVIQTVREKFSCRACEAITQPPAPFHSIARGRAGANLLAAVVYGKFGEHQPLMPPTTSPLSWRRWLAEASRCCSASSGLAAGSGVTVRWRPAGCPRNSASRSRNSASRASSSTSIHFARRSRPPSSASVPCR